MFNIALFEPEIPQNTGNIIRLCANTGNQLHLIKPLGFDLDDKKLRRAGLDYHEFAHIKTYASFEEFKEKLHDIKCYAVTTKGSTSYCNLKYNSNDIFLFGPETRGLPENILFDTYIVDRIKIPMVANSRSLNLSNSVSVIAFEAWRQNDFSY